MSEFEQAQAALAQITAGIEASFAQKMAALALLLTPLEARVERLETHVQAMEQVAAGKGGAAPVWGAYPVGALEADKARVAAEKEAEQQQRVADKAEKTETARAAAELEAERASLAESAELAEAAEKEAGEGHGRGRRR